MKSKAVQIVYGSIAMSKQVPGSWVQETFDPGNMTIAGPSEAQFTQSWHQLANGSAMVVAELSRMHHLQLWKN